MCHAEPDMLLEIFSDADASYSYLSRPRARSVSGSYHYHHHHLTRARAPHPSFTLYSRPRLRQRPYLVPLDPDPGCLLRCPGPGGRVRRTVCRRQNRRRRTVERRMSHPTRPWLPSTPNASSLRSAIMNAPSASPNALWSPNSRRALTCAVDA
jgi:hypothetical protein